MRDEITNLVPVRILFQDVEGREFGVIDAVDLARDALCERCVGGEEQKGDAQRVNDKRKGIDGRGLIHKLERTLRLCHDVVVWLSPLEGAVHKDESVHLSPKPPQRPQRPQRPQPKMKDER